jgi:GNAT superfamily N-acetyltransferase
MIIRDPLPQDEAVWRRLWADYCAFYEVGLSEVVTAHTWQRILDPCSPVFSRLIADKEEIVGFSVNVLHQGTWTLDPICYLEDLFVDPHARGKGAGRLLIRDLLDLARQRGWSRVWWHTRAGNPARRLYDEFIAADDAVRYRLILKTE